MSMFLLSVEAFLWTYFPLLRPILRGLRNRHNAASAAVLFRV